MRKRFGIAIIGGSGYGAGELIRLLLQHPEVEVAHVTSRTHAGKPITAIHTHLQDLTDLTFQSSLNDEWHADYSRSAIVCAMPTGQAVPAISDIISKGLPSSMAILDLSGDLRLRTQSVHETFYPEVPFAPELRSKFVYGIPELHRSEIRTAQFITNPGCLATAAILALAPLAGERFRGPVVVDAKTGTSGAGREPQASMHHPSRANDFTAYKALQHRHEPEILQALGWNFTDTPATMFIPHLIPVSRGLSITAYMAGESEMNQVAIRERYRDFYKDSRCIRFRDNPPRLVDVVGTNFCDLHIVTRGDQLVVMSAADNLGKGMAGQCVQNLNLMFGLPEETGLLTSSIGPV